MALCKCSDGLSNTGMPTCLATLPLPDGLYVVNTFDSDGNRNSIEAGTSIDDEYVLDKINEADKSKRWYPVQKLTNLTSERADPIIDEASNGVKSFVKEGVRPFSFELRKGGVSAVKFLKKTRCSEFSVFLVKGSTIIGMDLNDDNTALYPIRIEQNTFTVKYVFATDTTVEKVSVTFDFDSRENDELLSYIEAEVDLSNYNGLLDINSTIVGTPSLTSFVVKLTTNYGGLGTKDVLSGLEVGDFSLYRTNNTPGSVSISSVTEDPDGTYTFTIPTGTDGDILRLTPSKVGYDFTSVINKTITLVD
jgi:hypothetical protein